MAGFSNYLELEVLDHVFKVGSYTPATNLYVALCKSTIDDTHTGTTLPSEVTGAGYARKQCNTWTAAASGSTVNTGAITFAQAEADWGVVTDYAIVDASSAGNIIAYGKLTTSKTIQSGDTPQFGAGDLKVTLD